MEKESLFDTLYQAFFKTAEKYGTEIFTMSCYAKHGKFSVVSNLNNKEKNIKKAA